MSRISNRSGRRGTSDSNYTANRRLPVPSSRSYVSPSPSRLGYSSLQLFEDRRRWDPAGPNAPARSFSTPRHRLTLVDRSTPRKINYSSTPYASSPFATGMSQTKATIAFAEPRRVLLCVRRQQRKEVLHALRKTGPGSGASRYDNWNEYSNVRCR